MELGDVLADQFESDYAVLNGPENDYLQSIADRLLQQMPSSKLRFRIRLTDQDEINAITLPGGRIYVTRKLILAAHSEDELAGVIAHELGHGVTREPSADYSYMWRQVLGVVTVGDRADIVRKVHQFEENLAKHKDVRPTEKQEDAEQLIADQIAVFATIRAGYQPDAYGEFWDRIAGTKGRTGNSWTDFWRSTKPEQKRLREIRRYAASLPPSCSGASHVDAKAFPAVQRQVLERAAALSLEHLPGLLTRTSLRPALRVDLQHLRFSPDGKYLLAQDDSGIFVLTRQPLEVRFHITARNAHRALFSPDSQAILFSTRDLRIERWNIQKQARDSVEEILRRIRCLQSELAPDGNTLACLDYHFDFHLINVQTGEPFLTETSLKPINVYSLYFALMNDEQIENGSSRLINLQFSPDAHYVVASNGANVFAYDLLKRARISVRGKLKDALLVSSVFLAPDRIVGLIWTRQDRSEILRFPEGDSLGKIALTSKNMLFAPAKGDFLILRPIDKFPVGLLDISNNKLLLGHARSALDVYEKTVAVEQLDGQLALFSSDNLKGAALATVQLPQSPFSDIRTVTVSDDLSMLAASGYQRGAVWNLADGKRIALTRPFAGAYLEGNSLYADFSALDADHKRFIGDYNLNTRSLDRTDYVGDDDPQQNGRYTITWKAAGKKKELDFNSTMEVRDVRSNSLLWSRSFPREAPGVHPFSQEHT